MSVRARYTIDLHVHTINSDGRATTEEVLRKAAQRGVKIVVFAEHSRSDNYVEGKRLGAHYGVEVPFPAVEISTLYTGNKHHVIAYGTAVLNPLFQNYTAHPTEYKNRCYGTIVEALKEHGIPIAPARDIMRGIQPDGSYRHPIKWMLSRTVIAEAVAQALNITVEEAKALFMDGYDPARRLVRLEPDSSPDVRYLDTVQTIRAIRQIGAIPVLAHPWWELTSGRTTVERLLDQIATFCKEGLEGIEVLSYHYPPEQIPAGVHLAQRFGLLQFGGSDYHGNGKSELGDIGVTPEQFEHIVARVTATPSISIGEASRFAAVIFDAGFTLIHDRQSPIALVHTTLSRISNLQLTEQQVAEAEQIAHATLPVPQVMWRDDQSIHQALRVYYCTFLNALNYHSVDEELLHELIALYTAATNWLPYPEVEATLALLKLYKVRLGVVANWQSNLPQLLKAIGLSSYFDFVLTSAVTGVAKPDAAIFKTAAHIVGCHPEKLLYIGDDPVIDVEGAQAAGLAAVYIDRGRKMGTPADLRDVVTLVISNEVSV
jgi:HAD superfamily hydrolase (TIGR01509 family)